jgi:hypothetical protein
LIIVVLFPFSLVYIASRHAGMVATRHQLTAVYRTRWIGVFGQCFQLLRRFILVAISTFAAEPETVMIVPSLFPI